MCPAVPMTMDFIPTISVIDKKIKNLAADETLTKGFQLFQKDTSAEKVPAMSIAQSG
jgi:Ca2+-binding EF-hand superfamily protein